MSKRMPREGEAGRLLEVNIVIAGAMVTLAITVPNLANGTAGIGSWFCSGVAVFGLLLVLRYWFSPLLEGLGSRFRRRDGGGPAAGSGTPPPAPPGEPPTPSAPPTGDAAGR